MINYPYGKKRSNLTISNKKNKDVAKSLSNANRGMSFENEINLSNEYYATNHIAFIYKRPTPINVVKVDYTKGAKIIDAYFEKQSTTDYNGIYKGRYIDFEAKSCQSKTSFPLHNISPHQIQHLKNIVEAGGIAFFIIEFSKYKEVYLIDSKYIIDAYENGLKKSITYQQIKSIGKNVKQSFRPRLDYISIIDELYF